MKGRLLLLFPTVKHDQSVRETYQTSAFVTFQEMKLVVRRPLPELLKHSSSYNDITLTDAREIDKVQGCDIRHFYARDNGNKATEPNLLKSSAQNQKVPPSS